MFKTLTLSVTGVIGFLALMLSLGSFTVVDEGNVGIKKHLGKVEDESLTPGLHIHLPVVTEIISMSIQEDKTEGSTLGYTKDLQNVKVDFTANIRPDLNFMVNFYKEFGLNFKQKVIPQIVEARVKEVIAAYEAGTLVEQRALASNKIKEKIMQDLKEKRFGLMNFEITNLDYNDDFERAVERKVIAKEKAVEEQNRTVQVKERATQVLLSSKAEAESIKIKAEALSKNKDLVQLEAVNKWDGKLPTTIIGGNGALPMISVDKLSK